MTQPSTRLANLILVLSAFCLALAAVEVGIRVTHAAPASIYVADSLLLYRLAPGGRKTFVHNATNGGGKIRISINDDGFRGPPLKSAENSRRVMVYGDSFIEGEFAEDTGTFVRMLERELAGRTPTEVINAGVVGWGPDQAFIRMQQELPKYNPKLVILGVFADNDMGDLVRDRLFRINADSSLEPHHVILHPTLTAALRAQSNPVGWRRLHLVRWIERKVRHPSESLPVTRSRANEPKFSFAGYAEWALFNATRQFADLQANPDTVLDLLGDSYDVDVSAQPDSPSAQYKLALMERLLKGIGSYLDSHGTPFVLLIIPSPIDACDGYDVAISPTRYPQYDRRRISSTISAMATRHGIRQVDLWPEFQKAGACNLYFRGGDLHWNALGQKNAVRVLTDSLDAWKLSR